MRTRTGLAIARLGLLLGVSACLSLVQAWTLLAGAGAILIALALVLGLPRGMTRMLAAAALLGLPFLFLVFFLAGREATGSWHAGLQWGAAHLFPYALRMGDLVLANLLFIRTTPLAEIMDALQGLRLPAPVVLFLSTVLRFIPQILLETGRVLDAQRCRGLTQRRLLTPSGLLAVFVPLFLSQVHRARDLAISLEIRRSVPSSRFSGGTTPENSTTSLRAGPDPVDA